ncbi:MAG: hypothetical protein EXX96DRAFT_534853 [Benjaminiella poitrasii]|nr:MAG: hypothetical protein EXX96DRAFT_534853 [Benjaminiella poitrasii]
MINVKYLKRMILFLFHSSIKEKNYRVEQEYINETTTKESNAIYDDLMNDPILESLSKETIEYSHLLTNTNSCLSSEVVESLQSVKHICFSVLDLLLLQMVKGLARRQHNERRSFCDASQLSSLHHDVLDSITQNTNLLQKELLLTSNDTTVPMIRSKSSPPTMNATTLSDVYRILDSNYPYETNTQISQQDYTLCCSLAALLNDIYNLLELNSIQQQQEASSILASPTDNSALLQQELHDKVSTFQRERAAGIMTLDETDASQEMLTLWDEIDRLMNIVRELANQPQPPAYHEDPTMNDLGDTATNAPSLPPPAYESVVDEKQIVDISEKKVVEHGKDDLDELLTAMDRLFDVAPRLNNQRVALNDRQLKVLATATLQKAIERLSRGRMEDQRVSLPAVKKKDNGILLQELVQQIERSASRSLDNQRVSLQKKLDFASIRRIIFDRMNYSYKKKYYTDQDWLSHEEVLIKDLTRTTDLLVKSLDSHRTTLYNRQRFSMPATKERDLFMHGLFNKVESLEGHRLVNQDADLNKKTSSKTIAVTEEEDLQHILNFIYKAKPQLDNQRASFSL